jgi:hypothetical protein
LNFVMRGELLEEEEKYGSGQGEEDGKGGRE